ncbi:MAG: site-2 protease family protein [Pseudomonadota bacterium]
MAKTLQLGIFGGIPVQIHWTFSLLLLWSLFVGYAAGGGLVAALANVALVLLLFACVVLHEFGHALAARRYGIGTHDITLLPIGGVARLERMPRNPLQEIVVALAGPAVNVVIAASIVAILFVTQGFETLSFETLSSGGILSRLLIINCALFVFNLLPAFPMDGGRVFRASLALVMGYARATRIAARVGQFCALGFAILGLSNPFMILIAVFIFFGAAAEANQASLQEEVGQPRVRDGMVTTFKAVAANASLRELAGRLLDRPQRDYPVIRNGLLAGMLRREDMVNGLQQENDADVEDVMVTQFDPVDADAELFEVLQSAQHDRVETVPVVQSGNLIGLLDLRQAIELVKARTQLALQPVPVRPANTTASKWYLSNSWHD